MGLSDPTAVLDAITATVDETCACGCGTALAGSVSAWFAGPDCQERWQTARTDGPVRDGGRLAGIGLGYGSDAAGPGGGRPPVSPYVNFWTEMLVRGEVYLVADGGLVRPVPLSEEVQARRDRAMRELAARLDVPPELLEFDTTPLQGGLALYADALRTVVAGVGRAVEHLHAAGVLPPPPPDDPRQATLEAVRARQNSGPAGPVRAPRRIDPHGGTRRR